MYKNSLKSNSNYGGYSSEQAEYHGNFVAGKREGFGCMYWQDGSNFAGIWKNDQRLEGKMIMPSNVIYEGTFKNDMFDSSRGKIFLPTLSIYIG